MTRQGAAEETLDAMGAIFTDVRHAVLTFSGPDWEGEIVDYNDRGVVLREATMTDGYTDQQYPMPKNRRVFVGWPNVATVYAIELD